MIFTQTTAITKQYHFHGTFLKTDQMPLSGQSHNLVLLSASSRLVPCEGRSPKKLNKEKSKLAAPGEWQPQTPADAASSWLESTRRKASMLLPSSTGFLHALPEPALAVKKNTFIAWMWKPVSSPLKLMDLTNTVTYTLLQSWWNTSFKFYTKLSWAVIW